MGLLVGEVHGGAIALGFRRRGGGRAGHGSGLAGGGIGLRHARLGDAGVGAPELLVQFDFLRHDGERTLGVGQAVRGGGVRAGQLGAEPGARVRGNVLIRAPAKSEAVEGDEGSGGVHG